MAAAYRRARSVLRQQALDLPEARRCPTYPANGGTLERLGGHTYRSPWLRSTGSTRIGPRLPLGDGSSVVDCLNAKLFEAFDVVLHRLKGIGGVPLPICEFAGDQ